MKIPDKTRNQIAGHPKVLLILAAILHLAVATAVCEVGRHQLAPTQVYQNGLAKFATDGLVYEPQCVELCSIMKNEGPVAWLTWPTQLHVRLYSLPLMLFIRWTDFNILTIEPLNLLYFVAIIALVFRLGAAVFDRGSGIVAAAIVALWPSFILHTTQLLRDPLLIVAVLVFAATIVEVLSTQVSWRRAALLATALAASIVTIRIVRLPMWSLLCVLVAVAVLLLVVRFAQQKRISKTAAAFAALLIIVTVITPRFQPLFHNQQELRRKRVILPEEVQKLPVEQQIAARRAGFQLRTDENGNVGPADDGSRIDAAVRFHNVGDMVGYLPRAVAVGFFAPFPNMWFGAGKQVGTGGRWLSGFETALTYVLECFALIGLWIARRRLHAWFMFSLAVFGAVALGLVVNNIGALYRLRYPFWIMIVVFGSAGFVHMLRHSFSKRAFAQTVS